MIVLELDRKYRTLTIRFHDPPCYIKNSDIDLSDVCLLLGEKMKTLFVLLKAVLFLLPLICLAESKDVMDVLETESERFSTLVQAINFAGMADTLKKGPYTIFAPTNAAFANLSKDVLDELFSNANKMKSLLSSHIADGIFFLSDLTKLEELITIDGVVINIKDLGSTNMVGNSTMIQTDMKADSGVVHAVGSVLQTTE